MEEKKVGILELILMYISFVVISVVMVEIVAIIILFLWNIIIKLTTK